MKILVAAAVEHSPRKDNADALRCARSVAKGAEACGFETEIFLVSPQGLRDKSSLLQRIRERKPDCVFNLFEGFSQDSFAEVLFAACLEEEGIPFTGNGSAALGACLNKGGSARLLQKAGVRVPLGMCVRHFKELPVERVTYPVFLKPCREDGSVGIDQKSLCHNGEELSSSLEEKLKLYPAGVMVEEFVPGAEFNISFLGEFPYERLAVSRLDHSMAAGRLPFLSYQSKWDEKDPDYKTLTPEVMVSPDAAFLEEITSLSARAGQALGCRGYFRVDLRERDGKLFVLDVNPNPDINIDSGCARQAFSAGYTYEQLVERIVHAALGRKR